jgi:hypothetical protein
LFTISPQQFDDGCGSDDAGEFVTLQAEQLLVAGYQELGLSALGECKKMVIVRIG